MNSAAILAASAWAELHWAKKIENAIGGWTVTMLSKTDNVLANLDKRIRHIERKIHINEQKCGNNAESFYKLKLDLYAGLNSYADLCAKTLAEDPNSRANTKPEWAITDKAGDEVIEVEATEIKSLPEPAPPTIEISKDNPFSGEMAIEYEKARLITI